MFKIESCERECELLEVGETFDSSMHQEVDVDDSELIYESQKSIFLNANWQRIVDRTQEAEHIIAEVQHPDSWWRAHNKKTRNGWAQHSTNSLCLKASVWKPFGFYKVKAKKDLDKSHTICTFCQTKLNNF